MNMTFAQGCEISPAIKQQVHRAIRGIKPEYEIREVNTVHWRGPSKSSAYTHCVIEEIRTPCIVDTGAAGCIISKTLLDRIGWGIEEAANQKISVAVGPDHLPLGMIFDLPIQFGKLIIVTDAMVVEVDSYDLILGMDWLTKAKAIVDLGACKMKIM